MMELVRIMNKQWRGSSHKGVGVDLAVKSWTRYLGFEPSGGMGELSLGCP